MKKNKLKSSATSAYYTENFNSRYYKESQNKSKSLLATLLVIFGIIVLIALIVIVSLLWAGLIN